MALTKAWLNTSVDCVKGNGQPIDHFLIHIIAYFRKELKVGENYRNVDTLYSKWRELAVKTSKYSRIMNNIVANSTRVNPN